MSTWKKKRGEDYGKWEWLTVDCGRKKRRTFLTQIGIVWSGTINAAHTRQCHFANIKLAHVMRKAVGMFQAMQ